MMIFCSPPLYLTMTTWPSTLVTGAPAVPLVMVEPGRVHGLKPSPVPRCISEKIVTSTAFWLPSGCAMAPTPIKSPALTSAAAAALTPSTFALSASLTVRSEPSACLTVNVAPSAFSTVPRTICCCCCAAAIEATKQKATAPRNRRVIFVILNPPFPTPSRTADCPPNPVPRRLFRLRRHGQVGLDQRPQFRGHCRLFAEPQREAAHRLMQQHAETIGGAQSTCFGRAQQRRGERHVNQIGDDGVVGQTRHVDVEPRLPRHPEHGGVHNKARVREQPV